MNMEIIIGNLTRDPEMRDVSGVSCCTFTVAVNRRVNAGAHPEADYFRVTTWRMLAETCQKYLAKGRKVCVWGPVRAYGWIAQDGTARANLEMTADGVEFLTPKGQGGFEEAPPEDAVPPEMEEEFFGGQNG